MKPSEICFFVFKIFIVPHFEQTQASHWTHIDSIKLFGNAAYPASLTHFLI